MKYDYVFISGDDNHLTKLFVTYLQQLIHAQPKFEDPSFPHMATIDYGLKPITRGNFYTYTNKQNRNKQ